jgi:hypothetical protein
MINLYKGTLRFDNKLFEYLDRAWISHYEKDGVVDVEGLEKQKKKLGADHIIKNQDSLIFIREIQELEFEELKTEQNDSSSNNISNPTGIQYISNGGDVQEDIIPGGGADGVQGDLPTDNPKLEVSD